jgi:uncharacterized protein (UPF0147 family)
VRDTEIVRRNQEKLARAIFSLTQIADDHTVPRNVRNTVRESLTALQDDRMEPPLRIINAISVLDKIAQDAGMPSFARVAMWSAVSELESIRG